MQDITSYISQFITTKDISTKITPSIIKKCAKKLKAGKDDGKYGLKSDHIIHGSFKLYVYLSLLFNSMIVHGFNPSDLLFLSIISIPKDTTASLNKSDNYRGISLISPISKLFEYVILELHSEHLYTSDMQFGFKRNHSTIMCTAIYKEVVNHYRCNGSDVYSCLLDASKAFDRLHFGKLFRILLKRNIPLGIIRLLFDSYIRQQACALWGGNRSPYFNISNGIKQGGILSPVFFTIYIDQLLLCLKKKGIGCYMHGQYVGALSYADDITLLCPDIRGLNKMLDVCEVFGKENFIIFNSKKSMAIKFGSPVECQEVAILNKLPITWVKKAKHLGNIVNDKLSDTDDCMIKCSQFIGSFNKMYSNYSHLCSQSLAQLFKSFCTSFYGSCLWNYDSIELKKIITCWNISIRKLFKLKPTTHSYLLGPLLSQPSLVEQFYIRDVRFLYSLYNSSNHIVNACYTYGSDNDYSFIGRKINFLRYKYNFCVSCSNIKSSLHSIIRYSRPNQDEQVYIYNLKTLIDAREGKTVIDNFSHDDIQNCIDHICTI